ncbi:MAG: sigma 54 modulation/S30EA ribosomal C-terminal domain-containing protein, partial [Muribaculaceae bacterium]|nr:sigma 54 modulation/S30EA ribosomal C-terminal domain-containing protein [Muribaculaceae bacterium]
ILQMDLLDHDFFVFKNADTDTISVIYKRKDNSYGIIDTSK